MAFSIMKKLDENIPEEKFSAFSSKQRRSLFVSSLNWWRTSIRLDFVFHNWTSRSKRKNNKTKTSTRRKSVLVNKLLDLSVIVLKRKDVARGSMIDLILFILVQQIFAFQRTDQTNYKEKPSGQCSFPLIEGLFNHRSPRRTCFEAIWRRETTKRAQTNKSPFID